MRLMALQRREDLKTLDEKNSPFRETKAKIVYRNVANYQMSGSTYDAKHLD